MRQDDYITGEANRAFTGNVICFTCVHFKLYINHSNFTFKANGILENCALTASTSKFHIASWL